MAEPISMNEALHEIRAHAAEQLPPATAKLLNMLVTMNIAGELPGHLTMYVLDVGRELRGDPE